MDEARWTEVEALLEELLDLPPAEREARLAGRDPAVAASVRALLQGDGAAPGMLERGAGRAAASLFDGLAADAWPAGADPSAPSLAAGTRLGPWRLRERLGAGGMGEVWLAERADGAFELEVAVKLLKRGMDSEAVLTRFRREREILARLQHPGIARLLDAGSAPDGRPYFVMERVEGRPLTAYCGGKSLEVEARLSLLLRACEALDYAHRNLVVHRDLKPSNILVTGTGEVKLLDFGIAKLLAAEGEEGGLTRTDLRILTPSYAAPEQVLGEPVSTATDVYGLGVVLYELLTGRLPHRREAGSLASLAAEVERETVERPSAVVAREGVPLGVRVVDWGRLVRRLSGDLDTIVLKALSREPERRYGTAAALAEDLRRHPDGRPIDARPDTVGYRVGKFVRRHRAAVAAAALVVAALLAGLVGTTWQARRARANAEAALANAHRAERVKEFLIGLFEVADPEQSGGAVSAKEILEQAGKRLDVELAAEPEVQADLLEAVARIDRNLGLLEPAAALAERALALRRERLPADHPALASALATVGGVRLYEGRLQEAEQALETALARLEASEPADSLTLARVRSDYGNILFWQGKLAESEAQERKVWEAYEAALGAEHVQTAVHQRNVAVLLDELDRIDESEAAYRASQAVIERALGPDHVNTAQSYVNLATLLHRRRGLAEEAETLYQKALAVREQKLGADHPVTGQSLQLYALFLVEEGRLEESEAMYRRALELFRAINPKHFEVGKCLNGLARIAGERGDHTAAEETLREVVVLFREVLGEGHQFVWQATGNLARAIARQGRLAEAEPMQRQVLAKLEELTGAESEETATAVEYLGTTLRGRGAIEEATALHRRSLAIHRKLLGEQHRWVALSAREVALDLLAGGASADRAEARALLESARDILRTAAPRERALPEIEAELSRLSA